MKHLLTIVLLLLANLVAAQSLEDRLFELAAQSGEVSYEQLLDLAETQLKKPEEQARFFYYWIALNIEYDEVTAGLDLSTILDAESTQPMTVFNERKATCMGFTNLYASFLGYFGIDHKTIVGYSRHRNNLLQRALPALDHAWSAIKIKDEWKLVEVTWANLYINHRDLRDHYFMTSPEVFNMDHLPIEEDWQLTEEPLSLSAFTSRPLLDATYFTYAKDASIPVEISQNEAGETMVSLSRLPNWKLSATWVNADNEPVEGLKYKPNKSRSKLTFTLNEFDPGYTLRIDAKKDLPGGKVMVVSGLAYVQTPSGESAEETSFTASIQKPNRHKD